MTVIQVYIYIYIYMRQRQQLRMKQLMHVPQIIHEIAKHDITVLAGDFNAKVGRESDT